MVQFFLDEGKNLHHFIKKTVQWCGLNRKMLDVLEINEKFWKGTHPPLQCIKLPETIFTGVRSWIFAEFSVMPRTTALIFKTNGAGLQVSKKYGAP